jgi:hypothetical protein
MAPRIASVSPMPPDRAGTAFVIASLAIAVATALIGWYSDLRLVIDSGLAALVLFAFFPVLVVLALFALCFVLLVGAVVGSLVALSFAEAPEGALEAASASTLPAELGAASVDRFIPWYYRTLRRIRHPFFWAVPVGLAGGVLVLAVLLVVYIWPAEARTAEALLEARAQLEQARKQSGSWPAPTAAGTLPGGLLDGFDRPFAYETRGAWKLASWRVRSYGFDGKPGRDDMCAEGATTGMAALDGLARLGAWVASLKGKRPAQERFAVARALRCLD